MFQEHSSSGSPSTARLLVVDDQAFMRLAIKAILATDPSLEVVAEAQDGQQATQPLPRATP
jgi:chemotaxis response regulator CheB